MGISCCGLKCVPSQSLWGTKRVWWWYILSLFCTIQDRGFTQSGCVCVLPRMAIFAQRGGPQSGLKVLKVLWKMDPLSPWQPSDVRPTVRPAGLLHRKLLLTYFQWLSQAFVWKFFKHLPATALKTSVLHPNNPQTQLYNNTLTCPTMYRLRLGSTGKADQAPEVPEMCESGLHVRVICVTQCRGDWSEKGGGSRLGWADIGAYVLLTFLYPNWASNLIETTFHFDKLLSILSDFECRYNCHSLSL